VDEGVVLNNYVPIQSLAAPIEKYPDLIARMQAQEVVYKSGVLRIAKGHPGAGQIVAHARQIQDLSQTMTSSLQALTGMTYVAAGASVLTLGVSVAGFAIMNRRLKRMQASIDQVQSSVDRGFRDMRRSIDNLEARLVIATGGLHEHLSDVTDSIRRLQDELRQKEFARLLALSERVTGLRQLPDDEVRRILGDAERDLGELLIWLESGLSAAFEPTAPRADAVVFAQWYAVALALDGAVRFVRRSPADAAVRLGEKTGKVRPLFARASRQLVSESDFAGDGAGAIVRRLGSGAVDDMRAVQASSRSSLASRRGSGGPPDGARLEDRLLLAASLTQAVCRLEALADEWVHGDPRFTHPLAVWRAGEALPAEEAPILVLPADAEKAA
jgi:hypothetical protein